MSVYPDERPNRLGPPQAVRCLRCRAQVRDCMCCAYTSPEVPMPTPFFSRTKPEPAAATALEARHDQAVAVIDAALRTHRGRRDLTDVLLDVRATLRPPTRDTA